MTIIEIKDANELPPVALVWCHPDDVDELPEKYETAYRLKEQCWVPVEVEE